MSDTVISKIQSALDQWDRDDSTRYSQLFNIAQQRGLITVDAEVTCTDPREMADFLRGNIKTYDLDCVGATPGETVTNIMRKYRCAKPLSR
jgi:hypothetical protein